ncbi:hypothetical protein [Halorubrum sp. DTA98]|uniref:hypothetical protein n=1 Tax=Halorubrum sp. DTA98 TaxID=3402163 RepID=UPI003AAB34FA
MTHFTIGRWLLVALALVGLAFAAPVVSAHGIDTTANETTANETTANDTHPYDGSADDWATWMGSHMTEHMGPGAAEWMDSHMDVTADRIAQDGAHTDRNDGVYGQGHC